MDAALLGLHFEGRAEARQMKDLRCVFGRHKYQERHTPDTHPPGKEGLYLECSRCGKQTDAPTIGMPGAPDGAGGIALGGGG
jgi:hypothetical protein